MNPYWTDLVKRLHPYVPGEQPRGQVFIKLNTNENPYPPSPRVLAAIRSSVDERLRLYPDPAAAQLRESIAGINGVTADQVFVGNGSDEVLAMTFMAFFTGGADLLFPDISYSFYPVYCDLYGIASKQIPVEADLSLDLERYPSDNGGIIFANPNAPTSRAVAPAAIESLVRRNTRSVVVVDEAYVDFGAESAVPLVLKYPNLLITQTFSKSRSLAGLRIGFAIGDAGLIEALHRVKDSYNSYPLDWIAQAAATAAVGDREYFRQSCKKIVATRCRISIKLTDLGFTVLPSSTNFLFVSHSSVPGKKLCDELRTAGILVRHWSAPRIESFLRITIGTDSEMDTLVAALSGILMQRI